MDSVNLELYVLLSISLPVWLYFAYFDSKKSKGTFGKRIMKLTVVDQNADAIGTPKSFFRTVLKLAPWEISHLGIIFPTPMYFMENPDLRITTILGIVLFGAYIVSIIISPKGQSLYDKIVGTRVIRKVHTS